MTFWGLTYVLIHPLLLAYNHAHYSRKEIRSSCLSIDVYYVYLKCVKERLSPLYQRLSQTPEMQNVTHSGVRGLKSEGKNS